MRVLDEEREGSFTVWDLDDAADDAAVVSIWEDTTLFAASVRRGSQRDSGYWPSIISGAPGLYWRDNLYFWRWAVTASVRYLDPSDGQLERLMWQPESFPSELTSLSINGTPTEALTRHLGRDVTVTAPIAIPTQFMILARGEARPGWAVVDKTDRWIDEVRRQGTEAHLQQEALRSTARR